MANVEELRKKCNELHRSRREEVKLILTDWLELFILNGRVWRAVNGNKKCNPIPIHKYFSSSERLSTTYEEYKTSYDFKYLKRFLWPDIPQEEIFEIINSLGFIICSRACNYGLSNMALAVPNFKKGQPLTFAQRWVKKINHAYSEFIESERNAAKDYYEVMVSQLCKTPSGSIQICNEYTLFKDYVFDLTSMSLRCARYIRAMMHEDGLKEHYENGEYKGICVFYDPPQP